MQEIHKSSESSLHQKDVLQNSEILMLEDKLGTLQKEFELLSGIHSKCGSQKVKTSVAIQTSIDDEVTFKT